MTSKEKKKILKQFAQLDGRINELLAEKEYVCGLVSSANSGIPGAASNGSKVEKSVEKLEAINIKIVRETDELCTLKNKILSAIQALPNITERRVLWLHYIGRVERGKYKRLALWQIANEIGYSHDWIKHIHGMAIRHLRL